MKNFRNNLLRGVSILALLGGSYGLAQEKKERHVFLLIGQSNMAGRAKIEVEDKKTIDGAFLWNIGKKKWEAAVPPYNLQSPSRKNVKMQQLNCGLHCAAAQARFAYAPVAAASTSTIA